MKFPDLFKYNKYAHFKSAQPEPAPIPAPRNSRNRAPPPPYVFERPIPRSSPPVYSNTAVELRQETTRVEMMIILIHKGYTLADIHRHMDDLFGVAITAPVKGPRNARYFVYWEPVYRLKPHRLAITHGNWNLVMELLFTKGVHLGQDFARRCWIEVHVSTAAE